MPHFPSLQEYRRSLVPGLPPNILQVFSTYRLLFDERGFGDLRWDYDSDMLERMYEARRQLYGLGPGSELGSSANPSPSRHSLSMATRADALECADDVRARICRLLDPGIDLQVICLNTVVDMGISEAHIEATRGDRADALVDRHHPRNQPIGIAALEVQHAREAANPRQQPLMSPLAYQQTMRAINERWRIERLESLTPQKLVEEFQEQLAALSDSSSEDEDGHAQVREDWFEEGNILHDRRHIRRQQLSRQARRE